MHDAYKGHCKDLGLYACATRMLHDLISQVVGIESNMGAGVFPTAMFSLKAFMCAVCVGGFSIACILLTVRMWVGQRVGIGCAQSMIVDPERCMRWTVM